MTEKEVEIAVAALIAKHTRPNGQPKGEHKYRLVRFDDLRPDTRPSCLVDGIIPASGLVAIWGARRSLFPRPSGAGWRAMHHGQWRARHRPPPEAS